jgi:hypothetical protein
MLNEAIIFPKTLAQIEIRRQTPRIVRVIERVCIVGGVFIAVITIIFPRNIVRNIQ